MSGEIAANTVNTTGDRHPCAAKRCSVPVPHTLLMCARHWRLVPREIQNRVYREYRLVVARPSQPAGVSRGYVDAVRDAVYAVDVAERGTNATRSDSEADNVDRTTAGSSDPAERDPTLPTS